jgi:hypothetical protein
MPGSLTTPGHPSAHDNALGCVAFHNLHGVGTQKRTLSRLNGWPMRPDEHPTYRIFQCVPCQVVEWVTDL